MDDAAVPASIGPFLVLRKLGEGGMGVVYAGYDVALDRKVALKLIRRSLVRSNELRARMIREAQAMARLSHPNVVQVYQVGQHDDEIYMAMEYVEGATLSAWVQAAKRPWQAVLRTVIAAGRGLAAAHAAGLIHRDFKPKSQRSPPIRPCPADPRRSPENRRLEGIGNFSSWLFVPPRAQEVEKIWGKPGRVARSSVIEVCWSTGVRGARAAPSMMSR